jgi:hypothetical protein
MVPNETDDHRIWALIQGSSYRFERLPVFSSPPNLSKYGCSLFGCRKAVLLLLHTFARQRFNVATAIQPWKCPSAWVCGWPMCEHMGASHTQKPLVIVFIYSALGRKNAPPWLDSALSE